MRTYDLLASPTLYPGQTIAARLETDASNGGAIEASLIIRHATGDGAVATCRGPVAPLEPGAEAELRWCVPDLDGQPVTDVGIEIAPARDRPGTPLTVYLDRLGWDGAPDVRLGRPRDGGEEWRRAWIDAVDHVDDRAAEPYRVMHDRGTGLLMQGTEEWHDLTVETDVRIHLAERAGIAVHVRGLTRWVALLLDMAGRASLVRSQFEREVIAQADLGIDVTTPHRLRLDASGDRIRALVDDRLVFDVADPRFAAEGGAIALVCTEGRIEAQEVLVRPADLGSPA